MRVAYFLAVLAAINAGMATENVAAGLAVLMGLGALITMGGEIIKATRK